MNWRGSSGCTVCRQSLRSSPTPSTPPCLSPVKCSRQQVGPCFSRQRVLHSSTPRLHVGLSGNKGWSRACTQRGTWDQAQRGTKPSASAHGWCCAAVLLCWAGVYNPKKLLGVTTLDVVRANTFVAQVRGRGLLIAWQGGPFCCAAGPSGCRVFDWADGVAGWLPGLGDGSMAATGSTCPQGIHQCSF